MAPNPNLQEEISELMRFVAKKSKTLKKKMSMKEMCRQFKEETGTALSVNGLLRRIRKNRGGIHRMNEFDMDTKARMMMAVKAIVDDDFLRELRKEAHVNVDGQYRIIRYKKKQRGSDGPSTSPLPKRKRDSEADISGKRKRNRTASEDADDDEESKSAGEASSAREGVDILQGNDEQLSVPADIDQKSANLFHNAANIENGRQENHDENRVPEERAPENPAASGGDLRSDEAVNLFQNASSVGHRLDDQAPIENDYEEREQDENVDLKPLIDTQGIDGSGPASDIVVIHDQENQELIIVGEKRKPTTSVRDLLILMRGTLFSLESKHLNGLRRKIEAKIQKLSSEGDVQIPLENVHLTFDACLFQLVKHSFSKTEEESTSQRNFLCYLKTATAHLIHPSMAPFHEKLIAQIAKFIAHDQNIPIKIVHNAIDAILNFIDP